MLRFSPLLLAFTLPAMAEVPQVAVDIPPVHSLVSQVMEGVAEPRLILPPGLSPHDVALRPSDATTLAEADLVVWVGPELSPAVTRSVEALGRGTVLTLLNVPNTRLLSFRDGAVFAEIGGDHEEEHDHDHDHDHDHGARDPHAWLDPVNASLWVGELARTLAQIDPANADTYRENAQATEARLTALQGGIQSRIAPLRGRPFVVFHDAYHYFEARFEIEASGAISLGDGATPGPRRLAEIQEAIEVMNISCVFAEPQFNANLVEAAVTDAGAQIGVIDPLGVALEPGPDLYADLLNAVAASFEACLAPQ